MKLKNRIIESKDGTKISYQAIGEGPGLLIIHGAFRASQHYQQLAQSLSRDYTVYIVDRFDRDPGRFILSQGSPGTRIPRSSASSKSFGVLESSFKYLNIHIII